MMTKTMMKISYRRKFLRRISNKMKNLTLKKYLLMNNQMILILQLKKIQSPKNKGSQEKRMKKIKKKENKRIRKIKMYLNI